MVGVMELLREARKRAGVALVGEEKPAGESLED
jgi:hypothetical protein